MHATQPATLTVEANDPDGSVFMCFDHDQDVTATDYVLKGTCVRPACAVSYAGYGVHPPPTPDPGGAQSRTLALTFASPGTYHLTTTIESWGDRCGGSVYDSEATLTLDVTELP